MKLRITVKLLILTVIIFFVTVSTVLAQDEPSSIAILKSANSSSEYAEQHLGAYSDLFDDVRTTMNLANLRYEILNEKDVSCGIDANKYKILVLPMAIKLPDNVINSIERFVSNGGKIIVSEPGGKYTRSSVKLAHIVNVSSSNSTNMSTAAKVNWNVGKLRPKENTFPPSSIISIFTPDSSSSVIATWESGYNQDSPAVSSSPSGIYIGWPWGTEGNISFNAFVIKSAINNLIPGLASIETVKITSSKYDEYNKEITQLYDSADGALSTVIQADLSVPLTKIQEQMYLSKLHKAMFKSSYNDRQYAVAQQEYDNAKKNIIEAYARSIPSRLVEGRALWLDRGTVVSVKKPEDMKKLFDKIEEAGINVVYLETLNAGFPVYPSKYIDQNPMTRGYDPLKSAIDEAHRRDIELHAWAWIFAVGNTRHNPLIGKPEEYPGPVISNNFYEGALLGTNGNLLPNNQPEYWLDPANPNVRELMMNVLVEIVRNYDVDGIQLDYIRYPFQGPGNWMGFDYTGRDMFEKETGLSLGSLSPATLQAWNDWKSQQVSGFVRDVSINLRSLKPDIQISAAVYAGDRAKRLSTTQQDWELWVEKGWVDTLSPMSYATNTERLEELAGYVNVASNNKALVYPGLAIRQLDTAGFLEQLDTVRSLGMVGNTIFAMAHLNSDKLGILETGPYRNKSLVIPNRDPMKASSLLLEDFLVRVHRFISNGRIFSISKDDETKVKSASHDLYTLIQQATSNPSSAKLELAHQKSLELLTLTKEWLSFENNLRPGRVRLLTDYLNQITSILAYAKHKQETQIDITHKFTTIK
jgi:uncharacterized lipoprotein YddW (UPF0748 family)